MVEQVISIKAELSLNALGDGEALRERHVIVEGMRATIGVEADIADLAASGKSEWAGDRTGRPAGVAGAGEVCR